MSNQKSVVVVTRKLPEVVETRMKELFDARLNRTDKPMTHRAMLTALKDADVLVPAVTDKLDAGFVGKLPDRVKLIASFGVGIDHIDLENRR